MVCASVSSVAWLPLLDREERSRPIGVPAGYMQYAVVVNKSMSFSLSMLFFSNNMTNRVRSGLGDYLGDDGSPRQSFVYYERFM